MLQPSLQNPSQEVVSTSSRSKTRSTPTARSLQKVQKSSAASVETATTKSQKQAIALPLPSPLSKTGPPTSPARAAKPKATELPKRPAWKN
ncbi:uncharacterized protein M421DRAFT_2308 [Didymella exigua CBS 183.55]|uniref:Uncharacterized protein n=1 Tax=Didymella exigua CBS 183.55 TaxID=1150837 RepID=A0A6A5RWT5_9PLEO|nr:uncharacterized protein M421DRAFT_2308 [Didymella exigua CBS 183.55]KAF1931664.1 hypothetical protein M421DRAFT_2308 [Didymella exigua CBS 183.55]